MYWSDPETPDFAVRTRWVPLGRRNWGKPMEIRGGQGGTEVAELTYGTPARPACCRHQVSHAVRECSKCWLVAEEL